MSSINRIPTGWLGFLGIKNFGRNPVAVQEYIQGTWDLSALYLDAAKRYGGVALGPIALGANLFATVPQNRVWVVHEASCYLETAAGASQITAMSIVSPNAIAQVPITDSISIGGAAIVRQMLAMKDRPRILQTGESLAMQCLNVVGVANFQPFWIYTELDA